MHLQYTAQKRNDNELIWVFLLTEAKLFLQEQDQSEEWLQVLEDTVAILT